MAVPLIDIGPFVNEAAYDDAARASVAEQWDRAMTEVGFAIIQGHGVAPDVIALRAGAMAFFAEDASAKAAYNFGPYGNPSGGYTGMGTEAVSRTRDEHGSDGGAGADVKTALPDLVESYIYKPRGGRQAQAACPREGGRHLPRRSPARAWLPASSHRCRARPAA